jgi:hypothetical protein
MPDDQAKGDLEVIFSEDRVKTNGKEYIIKPWTLKQLMTAYPLLSTAFHDFNFPEGKNIQDIPELIFDDPQMFLGTLLPVIVPFLAISLNVEESDVETLEMGPATVILLKVLGKNVTHLKNFLSHAMKELMMVVGAMTKQTSSEDLTSLQPEDIASKT